MFSVAGRLMKLKVMSVPVLEYVSKVRIVPAVKVRNSHNNSFMNHAFGVRLVMQQI